ncbi:MAG: hypothetical protein KGJ37_06605 [Verrucomicrobiota bacterium]|nr:hypothetical protein [Verrucomicrobiota bacterium]
MKAFIPGKPYWWQWPTVLSLDAPAVAVLWQWLLARTARATLAWHHVFILGAAVWLVYAADRWIEGWRLAPAQVLTQRHWFYLRWRWPIFLGWLGVAAADLTAVFLRLDSREITAGFILLAPVLVYLLSHQLVHRDHPWRAPKELCVALLFTAGVLCFPLVREPRAFRRLVVPAMLFGALCLANCALISLWETEVDHTHGQTSLALQYPHSHRLVRALPWLLAILAAGFAAGESGAVRIVSLCAAASGLFLGAVDLAHTRCGRQLARVLADVALMTPLIPLLLSWLNLIHE